MLSHLQRAGFVQLAAFYQELLNILVHFADSSPGRGPGRKLLITSYIGRRRRNLRGGSQESVRRITEQFVFGD